MRRSRHTEFREPKLLCTSPISVAISKFRRGTYHTTVGAARFDPISKVGRSAQFFWVSCFGLVYLYILGKQIRCYVEFTMVFALIKVTKVMNLVALG